MGQYYKARVTQGSHRGCSQGLEVGCEGYYCDFSSFFPDDFYVEQERERERRQSRGLVPMICFLEAKGGNMVA
jgi:hypothetical protein